MLHAITQNKTTHYRRYLGHRDEDVKRVSEEDEIASTFLGPLNFMEAPLVLRFWNEVFRLLNREAVLPAAAPIEYEFNLWPSRRPVGLNRVRIEPDAHLKFIFSDGRRFNILIEFKWRAPLSSKDQLHRQWLDYLNDDKERNSCWHVFIAPETSAGLAAKDAEEGNVWMIGDDDRLILISWAQIRDALTKCQDRSDGLARWAEKTDKFLEKIGIRRFKGFTHAHLKLPAEEVCHHRFYKGLTHGFKGFGTITPISGCAFLSFFKE